MATDHATGAKTSFRAFRRAATGTGVPAGLRGSLRATPVRALCLALAPLLFLAPAVHAWWDTQIMYAQEAPRVANIEAQQAVLGDGATVIADVPPFGPAAGGGQAVVLKPGQGTLTWRVGVPEHSVYRLFVIARVPDAKPWENGSPEWPMFARLRVVGPQGEQIGDWTLPINYLNTYYDTARFSFPAHTVGDYVLEFSIAAESKADLVVDRLDLRDELGNTFKRGFKRGRYLHTATEVVRLRDVLRNEALTIAEVATEDEFRALLADPQRRMALATKLNMATEYRYNRYGVATLAQALGTMVDGPLPVGREPQPDPDSWQRHTEAFHKAWGTDYSRWNTRWDGRDVLGAHGGAITGLADDYLRTGDPDVALYLARLLIGIADLYPALDWSAQKFEPGELGSGHSRGIRFTFTAGRFGKIQYSGWEVGYPETFARMYDAIFPFIQAHGDELAALARTRIPWIANGADLVAFLDTRLLQYVGDCVNRNRIRAAQGGSESMILHAIAVQGPNPAGERLANWLYTRTYWDMTNDGGIQDQAITGRLRDGANPIGSVGYTEGAGAVLISAAELMSRFIAAGGDRAYDLSDTNRFPAVLAGAFFPLDSRVAGGYQPLIGDWGRSMNARVHHTIGTYASGFRFAFRQRQDPRLAWILKHVAGRTVETDAEWALVEQLAADRRDPQLASQSRNLEGFGLAILEDGIEHDDFTRKRALTFRHGAGKGHAHADALNLEFYAHGLRAVPDAGNRGGRPHPGHMSAHLGVTVDGSGMRNTSEINVGGTAWTTAFQPAAGAQYVAGTARFGVSPQVERYARQTVLVDIAGQDASYIFDVLRVAGGREHVWHTHGPARRAEDVASTSFATEPASGELAQRILNAHNNPRQGVLGPLAQVTWPVGRDFEQRMMQAAFDANRPPAFTRSTLLGHEGAEAFLGDSDPDAKGLENSQWLTAIGFMHVRRQGGEGLQTVWPQVIESYRGEPHLASIHPHAVTPTDQGASAPVAVTVTSASGQRDLLIADGGDGRREVRAGDATLVGEFGFVSHDAQGLRLAHLVGGTRLEHGGLRIAAEAGRLDATIQAVDYLARRITLDRTLPPTVKPGQELLINAPDHPQAWRIERVDGNQVTLALSPILYQAEILSVDEPAGEVICSMNPNMLLADPRYYDGTTATDEAGQHAWRVRTMRPRYIFMYIQEPVLDWIERYTLDDFPDTDGDGRRTVTITNWGEGEPQRDLTVEVAFVDEARQVIYFHLPEDEDVVKASGWAWAGSRLAHPDKNRWMVNEAGRRWIANYTGKSNAIALEGEVKDTMFGAAEGAGRRVLRMYHFGVGDAVTMPTFVHVQRQADGTYEANASIPATVILPDATPLTPR